MKLIFRRTTLERESFEEKPAGKFGGRTNLNENYIKISFIEKLRGSEKINSD